MRLLLNQPELLKQLWELVTLEPAGDVMQSTVVPHSACMMDELRKVYWTMQGYALEVRDLRTKLPELVKNDIKERAT